MFIIDIAHCKEKELVEITGFVKKKKKRRGFLTVLMEDITGQVWVIVENEIIDNYEASSFYVDTRIKIIGRVSIRNNNKQLKDISDVVVLARPDVNLSALGDDMRDQASRMFMSRICHVTSEYLLKNKFIQFESRVISNKWIEDGLEPLKVLYPGFGAPAILITSPAAQVMDFLTTTLEKRAFTVSSSFSTTYRFHSGPADLRVIVGKARNMDLRQHQNLLWETSHQILKLIGGPNAKINEEVEPKYILNGNWPSKMGSQLIDDNFSLKELNLINYSVSIPVKRENLKSQIIKILHVVGKDMSILAEGAREKIGNNIEISSFVIYPSQFLSVFDKAPLRQLKNLGRFNVWEK